MLPNGYIQRLLWQLVQNSGDSSIRLDADETAFLERELTQLRAKLFEVQYPDNLAMSFVPLATDIATDADTYSTPVLDRTGKAQIIGNGVSDLPRIDVHKDEILGKVRPIGASFGFDVFELRKAARLGIPLEMWKARAARAAVDFEVDQMLAFGKTTSQPSADPGTTGLCNNADVTVKTDEFTVWAATDTSDALLAELSKPATFMSTVVQNKSSLMPDTMLLAPSMFNIIANKPVGNVSDMTVLKWFLANNPWIKQIAAWHKLETANAGGSAQRAIVYKRDPMVLEGVVPIQFEQLPPQARGIELITNCVARAGGTKVYHPEAFLYVDHTG